jgi:hypothetical protein
MHGKSLLLTANKTRYPWHPTNNIGQTDLLNAIDKWAWAVGEWWSTFQSQNGPVFARGYWSAIYVREGDVWKIPMSTFNQAPPPAAPTETNYIRIDKTTEGLHWSKN